MEQSPGLGFAEAYTSSVIKIQPIELLPGKVDDLINMEILFHLKLLIKMFTSLVNFLRNHH